MDLVRSTDNTGQHIYTPTLRSRKQTASPSKGIVGIACIKLSTFNATRERKKVSKGEGPFSQRHPFYAFSLGGYLHHHRKKRDLRQSWNIGRGCDVARFITFRAKIEYRWSFEPRVHWIGRKRGTRKRSREKTSAGPWSSITYDFPGFYSVRKQRSLTI